MLLCLFVLGSVLPILAQNRVVKYLQITNFNNQLDTNYAELLINGQHTLYKYGQTKAVDQSPITDLNFERVKLRDEKGFLYYGDYEKGFYYNREFLLTQPVLVIDEMLSIKWVIDFNTTKLILGYECYKAVGEFRGRVYTAWFANQLPEAYGPWKLSGLPGLILEVLDHDNELQIIAQEVVESQVNFQKPDEKTKLTQMNYVNKFKKKLSQLTKYLASNSGGSKLFQISSKSKFHVLERSLFEN